MSQPEIKISVASPIYDSNKPLVKKLEYQAWNTLRIRDFMKYLTDVPTPGSGDDAHITLDEFLATVSSEELMVTDQEAKQEEQWLGAVHSVPSLRSSVIYLLEWVRTAKVQTLRAFADALEVYAQQLHEWSNYQLAALHTIMACQLYENEEVNRSQLSAPIIRDRAIELFEETRAFAKWPDAETRDLRGVKWWLLYRDLGIPLKFPRSQFHSK